MEKKGRKKVIIEFVLRAIFWIVIAFMESTEDMGNYSNQLYCFFIALGVTTLVATLGAIVGFNLSWWNLGWGFLVYLLVGGAFRLQMKHEFG